MKFATPPVHSTVLVQHVYCVHVSPFLFHLELYFALEPGIWVGSKKKARIRQNPDPTESVSARIRIRADRDRTKYSFFFLFELMIIALAVGTVKETMLNNNNIF